MNKNKKQDRIESVLNAYLAKVERPNVENLREWIQLYPQFERELTDFTVAWIQMETLPSVERDKIDDETLVLRGISIVQNIMHLESKKQPIKEKPIIEIKDIIVEGRFHGLESDQFSNALKITFPILAKLNRRLITYRSIPLSLIEDIAERIQRNIFSVVVFFQQSQSLPQNARFRSQKQPKVGNKSDFFDEIEKDKNLSRENKEYWLESKNQGQ